MTNIIVILEQDLAKGWEWIKTEAIDIYNTVSPIIASALHGFEQTVIQQLWATAATVVAKWQTVFAGGQFNLGDLEAAFLNTVSALGGTVGTLLAAAQTLGSNLIQSILGLLHAKLSPPAAPAVA